MLSLKNRNLYELSDNINRALLIGDYRQLVTERKVVLSARRPKKKALAKVGTGSDNQKSDKVFESI